MPKKNIGQIAEETGLSIQTIRYYESLGLLPAPLRSESGYRKYDDKTLYYFIKDGTSSYIFWSDFSKLDGADNAGLRVTYSTEPEARTVSSVNTIVRLVEAETQH